MYFPYGGLIVIIAYAFSIEPVIIEDYLITQDNIDILTQDSLHILVSP